MATSSDILIMGGGLGPPFNESIANQIHAIQEYMGYKVLTTRDIGGNLVKKKGNYTTVNSKYVNSRFFLLKYLNLAFIYIIFKIISRRYQKIILTGGIDSVLVNYIAPQKTILWITNILREIDPELRDYLSEVRGVIVQSKGLSERLQSIGIDNFLLYPIINVDETTEYQLRKKFTILFASAPNITKENENNYLDKGVDQLLKAFKLFNDSYNETELVVAWRGHYLDQLHANIQANEVVKVTIINENTQMSRLFQECHVTIIPYNNLFRSPELPLSGLESLYYGKPVVCTPVMELSKLIQEEKWGVVTENVSALSISDALKEVYIRYDFYQKNCEQAVKRITSITVFDDLQEYLDKI